MDTRCFLHGPGRGQLLGNGRAGAFGSLLAGSLPDFPTTAARYEEYPCYLIYRMFFFFSAPVDQSMAMEHEPGPCGLLAIKKT